MNMHLISHAARLGSLRLRAVLAGACGLVVSTASAWTDSDADTIFNSYNNAFYVGGSNAYYKNDTSGGRAWFWTQANMIQMAQDAYDRTGSSGTRDQIIALCNGFTDYHGTSWSWNEFNDDVMWACITFARAYQITGVSSFRDRAKANFDMCWNRAWSTDLGGGLWWKTSNSTKNACVNGPGAIAACLIYEITGESSYLTKARQIFDWQRDTLMNQSTGSIADYINSSGNLGGVPLSYNQGTFIGAGSYIYKHTGIRSYYEDAWLATKYTRDSLCNSAGRFYGSGTGNSDGSGFAGIGVRWIAKFAQDQRLWAYLYPWLKYNADLAWDVRRGDNLSWNQWANATPSGTRYAWECFPSVTALQVVPSNNPAPVFMLVNDNSGKSVDLLDGSTSNGSLIKQANYDYSSLDQHWSIVPTEDGDHFLIVHGGSGKILCVVGNSTAAGAQIHLWDYNGHAGQQWDFVYLGEGWYSLENVGSGLRLNVENASTADGAALVQSASSSNASQKFRLHPVGDYFIRTLHGKYLAAQGSGSTQAVLQKTKQNTSSFKWHFYGSSEGWERVSALSALNWAIATVSGSQAAGALVDFREYNASYQAQKIRPLPLANGKFKFYFKHSGMVWDIPGGSSAENLQMNQQPVNSYNRQEFELERTY